MGFFDPEIYNMLKDKFSNVNEISAMGGGAVQGFLGSTSDDEDDLVEEILNYLYSQGIVK